MEKINFFIIPIRSFEMKHKRSEKGMFLILINREREREKRKRHVIYQYINKKISLT
jgi:hypothetical protein